MKQQRNDAQMEVYKGLIDDAHEMKSKVGEYEKENQRLALKIKSLEHDLEESQKYKEALDFMKEEFMKAKQECHMGTLELAKAHEVIQDLENQKKKVEKKYQSMEV